MKTEATWKQLPTWVQNKLAAHPLGSPVTLTNTIRISATEPGEFELWSTTGQPVSTADLLSAEAR